MVVDNGIYSWSDVKLNECDGGYKIQVNGNPNVINRRKYRRMPLKNDCAIAIRSNDKVLKGKMVNISANGYAFATYSKDITDCKGKQISLDIDDFSLTRGKKLDSTVIRITNNSGEYIVGCRMLDDHRDIYNYVEANYKGE